MDTFSGSKKNPKLQLPNFGNSSSKKSNPHSEYKVKTTESLTKLNQHDRSKASDISILSDIKTFEGRTKGVGYSESVVSIDLPHGRLMKIYDMALVTVYNQQGEELFADGLYIPEVGTTSGKQLLPIKLNKENTKLAFFNHKHQICCLDILKENMAPIYFLDEEEILVDFDLDSAEDRMVILNKNCNIYYKSMSTPFLAEDKSIANLGNVVGKAVSVSDDGLYLMVGYECFVNGDQNRQEDNFILRKKSYETGLFEPYTAAYLGTQEGDFFCDFFRVGD
jgi:hypothetical protein